jgi:hypothetical protein
MSNGTADYFGINGIFDWTIQFPAWAVNASSVIMVSACELDHNEIPFKGLAVFTVHNVVPHDRGAVEVTIDTGWTGDPINVRASFVIDPPG